MAAKARVIEIERSTFVGTVQQLSSLLLLLNTPTTSAVVLKYKACNFVVVAKPVTDSQIAKALKTVPK